MTYARFAIAFLCLTLVPVAFARGASDEPKLLAVRGIYGGYGQQIEKRGKSLSDYGINAVWVGSGGLDAERIAPLKDQGVRVFAEFNTMHVASFVEDHPDAAPVGTDGEVSPPPDGWQGVCPTHEVYRRSRMAAFRHALESFDIDGIWLDYHHAHASWEQAEPNLPDTCFCDRCLAHFEADTGLSIPDGSAKERAAWLLGPQREVWTDWRCGVFTDWVREFRDIRDDVRPDALLGSFHCPWTEEAYDGALRRKLAIDLEAQSKLLDVLSPMPYHARFGHADDPAWIADRVGDLRRRLDLKGAPDDRPLVWPIAQLTDWGEPVPVDQVPAVLEAAAAESSGGVMVFVWGRLAQDWAKVEALGAFYRSRAGSSAEAVSPSARRASSPNDQDSDK